MNLPGIPAATRPRLARLARLPAWAWMPVYLLAYTALDWASYIRPLGGLNITPWNPQQALAIGLLMARPRAWAVVLAGLLVAEFAVRGIPATAPVTVAAAAALTATFVVVAKALRRSIEPSLPLADHRELLRFAFVVTAGSLASALFFVLIHATALPVDGIGPGAIARYWVGDAVSLLVTLPVLLVAISPVRRAALVAMLRSPAWWLGLACTGLALWVVFGHGEQDYFKFFYLLLPPVVWAAVRFGVHGAALSSFCTQLGLLAAAQIALRHDLTLFELQALMAATGITALLLGVAVDERARAEADLRASLRFSAAGQMAAALAHELSQPLTALNNYANACQALADRPEALDDAARAQLREVLHKLTQEARRTGTVTRRLRDFFRTGATSLQRTRSEDVAHETLAAHQDFALRLGVRLGAELAPGLPMLRLDPVQIAVVLRNLLANAIESAAAAGPSAEVLLSVRAVAGGVRFDVTDNGPGVAPERLRAVFEAPPSGKQAGLGVGLAICRSIAESHGGKLWAEPGPGGRFSFFLPRDEPEPGEPSSP